MITNEQLEMALVNSGLFFRDKHGLEYCFMEGTDISKYLDALTSEINKVISVNLFTFPEIGV